MKQWELEMDAPMRACITGCLLIANANLEESDFFVIFVLQDTFNLK